MRLRGSKLLEIQHQDDVKSLQKQMASLREEHAAVAKDLRSRQFSEPLPASLWGSV